MTLLKTNQKNLNFIKIMQDVGINPTTQRLQICHLLLNRRQHITAEAVISFFEKNKRPISKATVYNTLHLFIEKGLIQAVQIDGNKIFYDSYTKPHHHFYNIDTNELIDIEAENLEVTRNIALPEGMTLIDTQVIIRVRNKIRQPTETLNINEAAFS
jgi:Fur family iron response transcriptional regulator